MWKTQSNNVNISVFMLDLRKKERLRLKEASPVYMNIYYDTV